MTLRKPSDRVQIGLRLRESIRQRLEADAKAHGLSLNAEIEQRLERSFELEGQFGGPEMVAAVNLMSGAFLRGGQLGATAVGHPKWSPAQWMQDSVCYEAAMVAVFDALSAAQPGPSEPVSAHQQLLAKTDKVFAALAAHGAKVRRTQGHSKGEDPK